MSIIYSVAGRNGAVLQHDAWQRIHEPVRAATPLAAAYMALLTWL
jgi:hypothetical protein